MQKSRRDERRPSGSRAQNEQGTNKLVLIGLKARDMPPPAEDAELTLCAAAGTNGQKYGANNGCSNGASTVLALKGGKIFDKATITLTRKTDASDSKYSDSSEATAIPNKKTIAAAAAIAKLEDAAAAIGTLSATLDIKALIMAPRLKEQLAKAIDGEGAKYADATKTKVDNLLKEVIYENGDEIKNAVGKSLDDMTPQKAAVGGNGDRQLKAITSPQEIADAATYYAVRRFINEQEVKKKNQESPSCPTNTDKLTEPAKSADERKKHKTSETLQR
uniref:Variant surface glycoprotein 1125.2959 n=1 Tax=Trypanosoma brucei TaxID=5691 RepID=A0A1J0R950_9TRYP|nr:variant surface glycoprotein 1125.2959 [Trypanosoma brucei]